MNVVSLENTTATSIPLQPRKQHARDGDRPSIANLSIAVDDSRAENLDRHRDEIVAKWGERLYRRFRLYLWGCVHAFSNDDVNAYRLLLELPANTETRNKFASGRFSRSRKSLFGRFRHEIGK